MTFVAIDPSETRTPVPKVRGIGRTRAIASATLALALVLAAVAGAFLLFPAAEPHRSETIRIGRIEDWPEIKNGVPELAPAKPRASAEYANDLPGAVERSSGSPEQREFAAQPQLPASRDSGRVSAEASSTAFENSPPAPSREGQAHAAPPGGAVATAQPMVIDSPDAQKTSTPPILPVAAPAPAQPSAPTVALSGLQNQPTPPRLKGEPVVPPASDLVAPETAIAASSRQQPAGPEARTHSSKPQLERRSRQKHAAPQRASATPAPATHRIRNSTNDPKAEPRKGRAASSKPQLAASSQLQAAGSGVVSGATVNAEPPKVPADGERLRVFGIPLATAREVKDCLLEFRC